MEVKLVNSLENMEKEKDKKICCPFCGETGFDKIVHFDGFYSSGTKVKCAKCGQWYLLGEPTSGKKRLKINPNFSMKDAFEKLEKK